MAVAPIDVAQEKRYRKTIAGFKRLWVLMVKKVESFEEYERGISAITGIPETVVRASLPAVSWSEFAKAPEKYLPKALAKIEAAYKAGKWKAKYIEAFRIPA